MILDYELLAKHSIGQTIGTGRTTAMLVRAFVTARERHTEQTLFVVGATVADIERNIMVLAREVAVAIPELGSVQFGRCSAKIGDVTISFVSLGQLRDNTFTGVRVSGFFWDHTAIESMLRMTQRNAGFTEGGLL